MMLKKSLHVSDLQNEYYAWLCELVGVDQLEKTYWRLTRVLHDKEFIWSVPNDDNRAYEGKNLRDRFCKELDIDYNFDEFDGPATLLEVIISLAYRCSDMVDYVDKPMFYWFWVLLDNVGLVEFDDDKWNHPDVEFLVEDKINNLLNRTYKRNGQGGLFPMRYNKKDQRKVELWYQMSLYLVENYY